jgi:hypothetical protein
MMRNREKLKKWGGEMNILIKFEENKMRIKLELSEHQSPSILASINETIC